MLILKRDPNASSDEFFLVHHNGKVVGRIFNRLEHAGAANGATWFWGLSFDPPKIKSPPYGNAATREDAMTKFKAAWHHSA